MFSAQHGTSMDRPESPCVKICTLDDHNVCVGCFRTLEEIQLWSRMTPHEQWQIMDVLAERKPAVSSC